MSWIDERISEYYAWLRDNTVIRQDGGTEWYAVSTPFVGQFNDHIEIFVKREDGRILLSDDGETLANLEMVGVNFSKSAWRKEMLRKALRNYGVALDGDNELTVTATDDSFASRKHDLLSAIMRVSDFDVLAKDNVVSVFTEDVQRYLDELGVIYTPTFILRGKSGLDSTFDFQIAGKKSELVVRSFPSLKQNSVGNFVFSLHDVKRKREEDTGKEFRSMALVDDTVSEPPRKFVDALKAYGTEVVMWSCKETVLSQRVRNIA